MSKRNARSGASSRFQPTNSSITTRSAHSTIQDDDDDDDDDEESLDQYLKEAGMYESGMTPGDKKDIVRTLQASARGAKEEEERRKKESIKYEPGTPPTFSEESSEGRQKLFDKADVTSSVNPGSPDLFKSSPTPSALISEDESSDSCGVSKLSHLKELSISLVRMDEQVRHNALQSSRIPSDFEQDNPSSAKDSPCDVNTTPANKKVVKWFQNAVEDVNHEMPREDDNIEDSPSNSISEFVLAAKKKVTEQHISMTAGSEEEAVKGGPGSEQCAESDNSSSTTLVGNASPPTNEENNVSESENSSILIETAEGNIFANTSPLQDIFNSKTLERYPPHLRGLEEFSGDSSQWLSEARKATIALRVAYWKDVLAKNPMWKNPVTETGSNLKTLFKRPTFSSLFGDSALKHTANNNLADGSAGSARQSNKGGTSPQASRGDHLSFSQEEKLSQQYGIRSPGPSEHNIMQEYSSKAMEQRSFGQNFWDDGNAVSHNLRPDKKIKYSESEREGGPSSPTHSTLDVYNFDDKIEPENDWKQASVKNKKNNRRCTRSNSDPDFELQGRTSQQGRGVAGKRTRAARVSKGAISDPSKHIHQYPNSFTKKPSDETSDVLSTDENQANNERSRWLSKESAHSRSSQTSGTSPKLFYPVRKSRAANKKSEYQPLQDNQSISTQNNKIPESNEDDDGVVFCPICNAPFQRSDIEGHASGCQAFQSSAEGDLQQEESWSGGDHMELITNNQSATKTSPSSPILNDGEQQHQCNLCSQHFLSAQMAAHLDECIKKNASPSAGQKRGSSEDEGPSRKNIRRLSLTKRS